MRFEGAHYTISYLRILVKFLYVLMWSLRTLKGLNTVDGSVAFFSFFTWTPKRRIFPISLVKKTGNDDYFSTLNTSLPLTRPGETLLPYPLGRVPHPRVLFFFVMSKSSSNVPRDDTSGHLPTRISTKSRHLKWIVSLAGVVVLFVIWE